MADLAVIIPAYKIQYFDKALTSLAYQTRQDFTVYIGDDCSPYDLRSMVKKYENVLDLKYKRFDNNIGSKNLVLQWKRCVLLSKDEKWLWLFSDDDIADKRCVEKFFSIENNKSQADVYRFNTVTINDADDITSESPIGPDFESSEEMAYNLLLGKRGNSMPDHIFSRHVYERNGGFVYTRYAQAADWATSILFSKENGISIIPDAKLYWRYGSLNISSAASKYRKNMIDGHLQFIEWLIKHFEYLKAGNFKITYDKMLEAAKLNLENVIINHYKGFEYSQAFKLANFMHSKFSLPYKTVLKDLMIIKQKTSPSFRKLVSLIR